MYAPSRLDGPAAERRATSIEDSTVAVLRFLASPSGEARPRVGTQARARPRAALGASVSTNEVMPTTQ